ncbi:Futalosine hydrolase [Streptomyces cinereoruber]|uniref:Futalosine hydrolase n=1 Tax=Streptomyces cinereoruber TaxID=67260 RepID=A0AAV4KEB7_9ACTN|nr:MULTISPECIES: futalosine hydrolase [Streptomyces]AVH96165.1 futalosine hydrolase [Streptomyces sp. WAC00288]KYG54825.1 futalosine hydrolase [Streptomyces sp. WAC04657]MBB4156814.1 futalosine hydrolase [Streptomyces cinereoruber]MBY8815359.1 futalosine hydrolase [Streptomyces cinereoruber]NIH60088.1 futalosine hydrolase [Streptomyces cinereoruber]
MVHRILIVTAVAAEADSVTAGLTTAAPEHVPLPGGLALRRHADGDRARVDVLVGGVGPAAVAAATGTALAYAALTGGASGERPYDLLVSAGIAGGFRPTAPLGSLVVSSAIVAADLGAETPDGYLAVDALGFGRSVHPVPGELTGRIAAALAAEGLPCAVAPVLTVSTVTGTARRAAELAERHPGAAAEAMEGFGVAEAAAAYGVPVVELRAVSNAVGPRDRAAWRIGDALDALRRAVRLLGRTVFVEAP